MSKQKFISVKLKFVCNNELPVLRRFFKDSEKFCSKNATKIILDNNPVEDNELENRIGVVQVTLHNNSRSLEIWYREMIEKIGDNNPIWKHETCIYQLSDYLKKINEVSKIFSSAKAFSCRCEIRNEDNGDCPILDEKGFLIIGTSKNSEYHSFEIGEKENFDEAISSALDKCLKSFKTVTSSEV